MKDRKELQPLLALRGYLATANIYLGGSYATKELFPSIKANDIDVFIDTPRLMESWALVSILEAIFDTVKCGYKDTYKIPHQYMFVECTKDGIEYDLIFVNLPLNIHISEIMGSTLSQILYKLNYSNQGFQLLSTPKYLLNSLFIQKEVIIYSDLCVPKHAGKIEKRAQSLGLKYIIK